MTEISIHGRGGQGGVTLAKLIASAYFLQDKHVQAFGVYAAERSGAPVQAYVRIDDVEITTHNQIRNPDHVVVIDRSLIRPSVASNLKPGGWLVLNTSQPPEALAEQFPGQHVATVDATALAVQNGLGTKAVPIVNTTMLGAVARIFGLSFEHVTSALASVGFGGANVKAAKAAFEAVQQAELPSLENGSNGQSGRQRRAKPEAEPHTVSIFSREQPLPAIHTGDWASRQPHRHQLTPPCNDGCPAGNDVRAFVQAAAEKDYDAALGTILQTSPFPGICGRVCPAPCMQACNRRQHDEAVNVREIERYIADRAAWPNPPEIREATPQRAERVAVIGSGPAGLSCAYHLARLGYQVSLHEAGKELGGVLRTGIPAYRLPRDVLDREISFVLRHGVEACTESPIDRARLLELSHKCDAVFVATGLQESRALNLGRASSSLVMQGIDFLERARRGEEHVTGQRVAVIGGGNTAMDAARTALRIGARHVVVLYRRTRAEMPAIHEEIEEALEEGIELRELVAPLRLSESATGTVLVCQRMMLGEADASGRRAPVPIESEDAQFEVRVDRVIAALGQTPDLSIFPEGTDVHTGEKLTGLTGCPIFAGGDFATNEGTVTAAIGNGRRAALHVHRTLSGEDLFPPAPPEVATAERVALHLFEHHRQEHGVHVPPEMRRRSFVEVRLGLDDEPGRPQAALEAQRCLSCGVCNECDHCREYCPEGVMRYLGEGRYEFDYDYCKGCGICASQCPRGVVYMAEL